MKTAEMISDARDVVMEALSLLDRLDEPVIKRAVEALDGLCDALLDTRAALREMIAIIESPEVNSVCVIAAVHGAGFPERVSYENEAKLSNARRVLGETS